jgi:hypothetical protein
MKALLHSGLDLGEDYNTSKIGVLQLVIINLPDERTHFFVVVLFTL